MADLTTQLTGTKKLQFIFVPVGQTYAATTTSAADEGKIVFREETKTIDVRGVTYGSSTGDLANLTQAITALKEAGLMTETNGVYVKSTPITVEETGISLGTGVTTGTIKQFLAALQTEIGQLVTDKADKTEIVKTVNNVGIASGSNNIALDAAHVNVDDKASTPETVKDAIERLGTAIGATGTAGALSITKDGSGVTNPTIGADGSSYVIKQGSTNIATIQIGRELVVKSGAVVWAGQSPSSDSDYYSSRTAAETAGIIDPEAYIKLVIDNNESTPLYIPANALVDTYTENNAQGANVIVTIDQTTNKISASLSTDITTSLGKADSAIQGVQVNGSDLTKDANNKVNVKIAEGTNNGTIKVNETDINVHGLGSAAYTASTAYDAAGAAAAVLGTSGDTASANTVYGAKAYADDAAGTAETNAKDYADSICSWTVISAGV